ncbi:MAG TPA: hypothetical protein VIM11_19360 [Tepidisphaeraceae bacterium]
MAKNDFEVASAATAGDALVKLVDRSVEVSGGSVLRVFITGRRSPKHQLAVVEGYADRLEAQRGGWREIPYVEEM